MEHFHIASQCQLSCGIILRPIIKSLKRKELNSWGVNIMNSLKAQNYYSFVN